MKTLEEIEKIDFSQLEAYAEDRSIEAPADLMDRIKAAGMARALKNGSGKRRAFRAWRPALASALAVAAGLAIVLSIPRQPEDTFDDPRLAYAEVERTLEMISNKMDKGLEIAGEAGPIIEKTNEALYGKR